MCVETSFKTDVDVLGSGTRYAEEIAASMRYMRLPSASVVEARS